MPHRNHSLARGYMVVEVLVALALAGLVVVTIGGVLSGIRKLQTQSSLRQQALNYARQSLEAIDSTYNANFKGTPGSTCTLMSGYTTCWDDHYLGYNATCAQVSTMPPFFRTIAVADLDPTASRPHDVKKVTVQIFNGLPCDSAHQMVTLTNILTAWKN